MSLYPNTHTPDQMQRMIEETLATVRQECAEDVAQGGALLDVAVPGWARRIDTQRLKLASCADCILGQLYGSFDAGCRALARFDEPIGMADRNGFASYRTGAYDDLQAEWLKAIEMRVAA